MSHRFRIDSRSHGVQISYPFHMQIFCPFHRNSPSIHCLLSNFHYFHIPNSRINFRSYGCDIFSYDINLLLVSQISHQKVFWTILLSFKHCETRSHDSVNYSVKVSCSNISYRNLPSICCTDSSSTSCNFDHNKLLVPSPSLLFEFLHLGLRFLSQ